MKSIFLTIFSMTFFICGMTSLSAHALFVDSNPTGKSGVTQEVIVFYAEPNDGKKEAITDWWADVSEFKLWLHHPDGTKKQLEVTSNDDHFTASFIPEDAGVYFLSVSHSVGQLAGTTQYVFNASAQVVVDKNTEVGAVKPTTADQMILVDQIHRLKHKKKVSMKYFYNEKPGSHSSLSIFSPSGWEKAITTESDGNASFVPEWKGQYFIETIQKENVTGQPHEELVQIYTTQLVVR